MRLFTKTLFAIAIALTLGFACPVRAADFSGTWVLDKAASDDIDPLLKAQGVSGMKRRIISGLDVTLNVEHEGDQLTIETVTSMKTNSETIRVDGETRDVERERGTAKVRHEWKEEALVTTSVVPAKNGEATVVNLRSIGEDGRTMHQRLTLKAADGTTTVVNRLYRKS